ncbi:MAG TPA: hypothetical protein VHC20_05230 [Candidatus Paceibacterota bacterium]|nr:hypothetical protein [Candidatus Paceibacterota bacterium]
MTKKSAALFSLVGCLILSGCSNAHSYALVLAYPLMVFDPHTYHGHDGSSWQNAVVIDVAVQGEEAVMKAESAYVREKFKVDEKVPVRRELFAVDGFSPFHMVSFTTMEGKEKKIYFDVSATTGKITPPALQHPTRPKEPNQPPEPTRAFGPSGSS